jgi:WD40 repeat protein
MVLSPDGCFLVSTCNEDVARVVFLDGSAPRLLGGFDNRVLRAAVGAQGRFVAVPGRSEDRWIVRLWELETGKYRDSALPDVVGEGGFLRSIEATGDGRVVGRGPRDILYQIDPTTGRGSILVEDAGISGAFTFGAKGDLVVARDRADGIASKATVHNLAEGSSTTLSRHGNGVISFALDPDGSIVATGSIDGIIRVGPATGEIPHWLVGHEGAVRALAFSPDGRTIASGGADGTIRLWTTPDLTRPPLQDLPRDELVARLRLLINRRVVQHPDDPEGYRITVDPFPGWATVPQW